MDCLPTTTETFVGRIQTAEKIDSAPPPQQEDNLTAIAFIVTLIDSLHASVNATFLSISYASDLAAKLGVDLTVAFTLDGAQWTWRRHGRSGGLPLTVESHHSISCDFDGKAQHQLSRIGGLVLNEELSPEEGLRLVIGGTATGNDNNNSNGSNGTPLEQCYRNPPGRTFVVALMASGTSATFFSGTRTDVVFASLAGLLAGFLHLFCSEGIVSACASFYAMLAVSVHPEHTCFKAQVLGTLFWFFHGVAFIIALFEISSGQWRVGSVRCLFAAVDSFRTAVGVAVGALAAAVILGEDMAKTLAIQKCHGDGSKVYGLQWYEYIPLFLSLCIAVNMQLRVDVRDWPVCFFVMCVTQGSFHVCDTMFQYSDFVSNLVPSFLATFSTFVILRLPRNITSHGSSRSLGIGRRLVNSLRLVPLQSSYSSGFRYDYRDAWFCIFPSLYLLVPGSGLVKAFLFSITRFVGFDTSEDISPYVVISIFLAGTGQVLGVRLGLAVFRVCARGWRKYDILPR
mmetsp:Transcript_2180/g.4696  ORF Transcript_2180/g.4696 Transcript_2180/m.4696 type:complete len:512 (-) Transcript_2180:106-1641(-)